MTRARPWVVAVLALLSVPFPATAAFPADPWLHGPDFQSGLPVGTGRHFRVQLDVSVPAAMAAANDLPVLATINLAVPLAAAGYPHDPDSGALKGFTLDLDSFLLAEIGPNGQVKAGREMLPVEAVPVPSGGFAFDASTNPTVALRWILPGAASSDVRRFHVYFDSLHHGDKVPPVYAAEPLERLAAAIGPGRGTRFYIPLYSLSGPQGGNEFRSLRFTSLYGPTEVRVFEYTAFDVPESAPAATLTLTGMGDTDTYFAGQNGLKSSRGVFLVESDAPILVEGVSRGGDSSQFIPSESGGYTGREFRATPARDESWSVFCPKTPETTATACRATVTQGGASRILDIGLNGEEKAQVVAGVPVTVTAPDLGAVVAVQRDRPGMTVWPPMDGPRRATLFLGEANPTDRLQIAARGGSAKVQVQSLQDLQPVLDGALQDLPLDSTWNRPWISGRRHVTGTAMVKATTSVGGVIVQSGEFDPFDSARYGVLSALQSSDGGRTYDAFVPADAQGAPMGRIYVFAPFEGTQIQQATRTHGGVAATLPPLPALAKDQTFVLDGVGSWRIRADRPLLAAWVHVGTEGFSGFAPGFTDITTVVVSAGQYAARAFDLVAAKPIELAEPNDFVEFTVQIRNMGRRTDGSLLADGAQLSVRAPASWGTIRPVPSTVELAAGGSAEIRVPVNVPSVNLADGGATLTLEARPLSNGLPASSLVVEQDLRINFDLKRKVVVLADGEDVQVSKEISPGDPVSYVVTVTNAGSVEDTYEIDISEAAAPWQVTTLCPLCPGLDLVTPLLQPGATAMYIVEIVQDPPTSARLVTQFLAVSTKDRSTTDGVRIVTDTGGERSIGYQVDALTKIVRPGNNATFSVRLINRADGIEELAVTPSSLRPATWPAPTLTWVKQTALGTPTYIEITPENDTLTVAGQSSELLLVNQTVPANATPGQLAIDRLGVTSNRDPTDRGFDIDLRAIAGRMDGFLVDAPTSLSLAPGQETTFNVRLTSNGNAAQSLRLAVSPSRAGAWAFSDAAGKPPPWTVSLAPGAFAEVAVKVRAPADLMPTSVGPTQLDLLVSGSGVSPLARSVEVQVAARQAVAMEAGRFTVVRGYDNPLALPLRNEGNLELDVTGTWQGLPAGWSAAPFQHTLRVGEASNATASLYVPSDGPRSATARLVLVHGGDVVAEYPVAFTVADPAVTARLLGSSPLAGGHAVYRIEVSNGGAAAAYRVDVQLVLGDEVQDRIVFQTVLPGATQVANLIGPADAEGLAVEVASAHGDSRIDLGGAPGPDAGAERSLPLSFLAPLAAVAAAASAWRRRR